MTPADLRRRKDTPTAASAESAKMPGSVGGGESVPEIRWICLLPDPVTGLDAPVRNLSGQPMIWFAQDKAAATAQVKTALEPNAFRLCAVISALDWNARRREPQRAKLAAVPTGPRRGYRNPRQACRHAGCRSRTPTRDSMYCRTHARRGRYSKNASSAPPNDNNARG